MKMFKIVCLSLFLSLSPLCLEAKIYEDIYVAQKQALKEAKLMVFFVVSSQCQHCHKLLNEVMSNESLMKYLEDNFIVSIADLENKGVIPKDLLFNGVTPTTYILTPTGNVIGTPIEGAIESNMLFTLLKGLEEYKEAKLGF